jgi:glycosyltransferase involved in cell wall biosynthesis
VISDNASDEVTQQVVQRFNDPRFLYYANGENLGMIKSFNKSLERANSEFVIMITDDDFIYPDMLQSLYDLYVQNPGYGAYIGSHDTFYTKHWLAKLSNVPVGTNSSLADMEYEEVRKYDPKQFLQAFFKNEFGGGILWSVAIVEKNIALEIGGVPDFGTPFLTDCSYILLSTSRKGAVFINKAIGCLSVHGDNYSYIDSNYEKLTIVPEAFYSHTINNLPASLVDSSLKKLMKKYIGSSLTVYFSFLKKIFLQKGAVNKSFEDSMKKIYKISYMRKWKFKYVVSSHYPGAFKLAISLKRFASFR